MTKTSTAETAENMVGTTTRRVTFDNSKGDTHRYPAGTQVYVRETRDGWLLIRVPGTLFTQKVNGNTVQPA